jgi:hypothetical protein
MTSRRSELQKLLEDALGSRNVYFQPPSVIMMRYPCIVYRRSGLSEKRADGRLYASRIMYQVTVIDPDPDSEIPGRIAQLPLSRFDRHYTADNLNHDVYNLYY